MKETTGTPRRRGLRRGLLALAGIGLGLAIAEGAFWWRDRGAFPHLNVYVADPALGVRLMPGATERVALPGNPVTEVRINEAGLRGRLPPGGQGEIAVVGDSQVFGLGVEEHETTAAQLGQLLGVPVVNAGVPTYGPLEYSAVAGRLLRERPTRTVVYVVNFSNDLFEARRPNVERHAVWDGWAVRLETAPLSVTEFPGRDLLFRRSHLFYALRGYWHRRGPQLDDQGFRSEGGVSDLFGASQAASEERRKAARATAALAEGRAGQLKQLVADELQADLRLEKVALGINEAFVLGHDVTSAEAARYAYVESRNNPGDIIYKQRVFHEDSRDAGTTFTTVLNGARVRREVEQNLRAIAEEKATQAQGRLITASLEEREALRARIEALRAAPAEIVRAWSPMAPVLRELKQRCDAAGARLVVVALPMDVQVSPAEAAKYGERARVDMAPTRILLDDLVETAAALGAIGVNALPALSAAEPGAFLPNDLHMTPRGHAAVAQAVAEALRASP